MYIREVEKSESEYEEMLNDIYGTVEICGMTFDSGRALKELDPIAFRCGMSDLPLQYQCTECDKIYNEDDEPEAEACCKPEAK